MSTIKVSFGPRERGPRPIGGGTAGASRSDADFIRLMRIPSGQKNLLAVALVAGTGFVATLYLIPTGPPAGSTDAAGTETVPPVVPGDPELSQPEGTAADHVAPSSPAEGAPNAAALDPHAEGFRGYALPLAEVRGLSPETPMGSRVELWVAWEPPITKEARVQRLLRGAVVEQIVPPTVPEGPVTVELLIPVNDLPDFIFAQRYGSLSAAVIP